MSLLNSLQSDILLIFLVSEIGTTMVLVVQARHSGEFSIPIPFLNSTNNKSTNFIDGATLISLKSICPLFSNSCVPIYLRPLSFPLINIKYLLIDCFAPFYPFASIERYLYRKKSDYNTLLCKTLQIHSMKPE